MKRPSYSTIWFSWFTVSGIMVLCAMGCWFNFKQEFFAGNTMPVHHLVIFKPNAQLNWRFARALKWRLQLRSHNTAANSINIHWYKNFGLVSIKTYSFFFFFFLVIIILFKIYILTFQNITHKIIYFTLHFICSLLSPLWCVA